MGATGDITLKIMIFLTGLIIIVILIALESPGIHSIYRGINLGVGKSGVSLIIDKFNDVYNKYYIWALNHDVEEDSFNYETQFNVMLSSGVYILYPDKGGYYRISYYSESSVDIYQLSVTAIDTPEKFNSFIKNSDVVASEYLGFKYTELTIQGICPASSDSTRALIFFVESGGEKVVFNLKVTHVDRVNDCPKGSNNQIVVTIENADAIITEISYSALTE